MVSLVERIKYNASIQDNPKIALFSEFLKKQRITYDIDSNAPETDRLYFGFIISLCNNEKNDFTNLYNDISRRKPSQDSPWIMNDFLVFLLICGVVKFGIDKTWILDVINARPEGNAQNKPVNQTLRNLINGNFLSTDNLFEIVVVFLDIQNQEQVNDKTFNILYRQISENASLLNSKNDFLICITLRAYDVIVTTKDTPDGIHNKQLKDFQEEFKKRILIASNITYGLVCLSGLYLILHIYRQSPDLKNFVTDIGSILAIVGVGLFITFINKLRISIEKFYLFIFGYSKSFSDKNK
jgi:hypothetical protein